MPIAPEGRPLLAAAAVLVAIVWLAAGARAGIPAVGGWVALASFFRDPRRTPPADARAIVAPADGRVVKVERVEGARFLEGAGYQVGIFMSPLDVHVNRVPASGWVRVVEHRSGRFLRAFADEAPRANEQNAVCLEDAVGRRFAFVQVAGFLARRIVCRLRPGMWVERGERCGIIMFGSRVDVYLPAGVEMLVGLGARTRAGETVIARWAT